MKLWKQLIGGGMLAVGLTLTPAAMAGGDGCGCNTSKTPEVADSGTNIVTTAKAAGSFNTLLAAAEAAGLAETLATGGPFTVLAPDDDAFAALPEGTVENLLKPENKETLKSILLYHVVAGEVPSQTVVTLTEAETLSGESINIDASSGSVKINNATVTAVDIDAGNGIIHVIDTVLLPSTQTASAE